MENLYSDVVQDIRFFIALRGSSCRRQREMISKVSLYTSPTGTIVVIEITPKSTFFYTLSALTAVLLGIDLIVPLWGT